MTTDAVLRAPQVESGAVFQLAPSWWSVRTEWPWRYAIMPGFFDPLIHRTLAVHDRIDIVTGDDPPRYAVLTVDKITANHGERVTVSILTEYRRPENG